MKRYVIGSHIEAYPYEDTKLNIYNRNTGKTFVLGEKEALVFKLMDGANSLEDIHSKCDFYSIDEIEKLAVAFSEIGLFEETKKKFNPFKIKMSLFNPNRLLNEDSNITKIMHYLICVGSPLLLIVSLVLMRVLKANPARYVSDVLATITNISVVDIIGIILFSLLCLALHEFGHMISARKYGVNVPEIGVMLYFLIPCAYTNISGVNLLKSKCKRLVVLLSGSLVNIGLIGICYLLMALSESTNVGMYCFALIIVNLGTIFMNTMILIKFDGYYILETITDEPKLRENAIGHVFNLVKIGFGRNSEMKKAFKETLRADSAMLTNLAYCVYAVLSVAYVPFVMLNTVIPFFF